MCPADVGIPLSEMLADREKGIPCLWDCHALMGSQ